MAPAAVFMESGSPGHGEPRAGKFHSPSRQDIKRETRTCCLGR